MIVHIVLMYDYSAITLGKGMIKEHESLDYYKQNGDSHSVIRDKDNSALKGKVIDQTLSNGSHNITSSDSNGDMPEVHNDMVRIQPPIEGPGKQQQVYVHTYIDRFDQ